MSLASLLAGTKSEVARHILHRQPSQGSTHSPLYPSSLDASHPHPSTHHPWMAGCQAHTPLYPSSLNVRHTHPSTPHPWMPATPTPLPLIPGCQPHPPLYPSSLDARHTHPSTPHPWMPAPHTPLPLIPGCQPPHPSTPHAWIACTGAQTRHSFNTRPEEADVDDANTYMSMHLRKPPASSSTSPHPQTFPLLPSLDARHTHPTCPPPPSRCLSL